MWVKACWLLFVRSLCQLILEDNSLLSFCNIFLLFDEGQVLLKWFLFTKDAQEINLMAEVDLNESCTFCCVCSSDVTLVCA